MGKTWQELRDNDVLASLAAKLNRMIQAKTPNQALYIKAIQEKTVIISTGCAGTGKTFIACGIAAKMLKEGKVKKIILTRPLVPCGKGYGFRPGSVLEKVSPTMRPMLDALHEFLSPVELKQFMEDGTIEILPLDDMRGCSLPNTFIICDECQNAEFNQLHMLLTRFGENSKVVMTGDVSKTQTDLMSHGENPLKEVIRCFSPNLIKDIAIVRFTRDDIVRHPLIRWIDERLVDGPPKVVEIECPNCENGITFEEKAKIDNHLVKCCCCGSHIDLLNEDDFLDPVVHHFKIDEKEKVFDSYPSV